MIRNKPIIRFNEYTSAWEQCELLEGMTKYTNRVFIEDDKMYKQVSVKNIGEITLRGEQVGSKIGRKRQAKVNLVDHPNTLIFTRQTVEQGGIGFAPKETDGAIVTENMPTIDVDTRIFDRNYLMASVKTIPWYRHIILTNIEGGTAQVAIHEDSILASKTLFPKIEEQIQIGNLLKQLDDTITLHQRKLDITNSLKKIMLSKMFPKNDEHEPEIRISGFTDAWEQRKLGDHCEMFNGDRSSKYPNAQDMVSDGIPFINAGDLENGHVNLKTAKKISREKYDELSGAKLQLGDIVYCLRGTLGKNAYIDNFDKGTVASSLVAIRPKNIDGRYLYYILNSDIEYKQRIVHDEGAAQPNLSAKSVSEFVMPVPDIDEQKKMSAYFSNLDHLIALHQRELEKLKLIKQYLLKNMFV